MIRLHANQSKELGRLAKDGKLSAAEYQRVVHGPAGRPPAATATASKYNAQPTEVGGTRFDSKHEAAVYESLIARDALILRQVPFHLAGGVRYVADFLEILDPAAVRVIDAKGVLTQMFRTKQRLVEATYAPLQIETVTREQLRRGWK